MSDSGSWDPHYFSDGRSSLFCPPLQPPVNWCHKPCGAPQANTIPTSSLELLFSTTAQMNSSDPLLPPWTHTATATYPLWRGGPQPCWTRPQVHTKRLATCSPKLLPRLDPHALYSGIALPPVVPVYPAYQCICDLKVADQYGSYVFEL